MMNKFKIRKSLVKISQGGFALLYAILISAAVLSVGMILMNIITKQLIFSSISRNSEVSYYYAANSGWECLKSYIDQDAFVSIVDPLAVPLSYELAQNVSISCFEGVADFSFTPVGTPSSGVYRFESNTLPVTIGTEERYIKLTAIINLGKLNGANSASGIMNKLNYLGVADGYNQNPLSAGSRATKRSMFYTL